HHGGLLGETLYWSCATLFQRVGAHIVAVLLLLVGGLMLTGTSIAAFIAATWRTLRRAHAGSGEIARTVAYAGRGAERDENRFETQAAPTDVMSEYPDEELETVSILEADEAPEEELEPVTNEIPGFDEELHDAEVHEGVSVEANPPAADAEPGPGEDVDSGRGPAEASTRAQGDLTPMGEKRGVTEAEDIDYEPPPVKLLDKGKKADTGPDPRDQEAIGRTLVE